MFHSGRLARYIYMRCCGGNGADVSHPRCWLPPSLSAPPSPLRGHMYFPQGATDRHRTYNGGNNSGYRWPRDVWDYRFLRVKPSRPDVNVLRRLRRTDRADSKRGTIRWPLTLHAPRARAHLPFSSSRSRSIIGSCGLREEPPPPPPRGGSPALPLSRATRTQLFHPPWMLQIHIRPCEPSRVANSQDLIAAPSGWSSVDHEVLKFRSRAAEIGEAPWGERGGNFRPVRRTVCTG